MNILTEKEAKAMPLDEYCEWMLLNGYYDVTPEGIPFNPRRGNNLKATINAQGYKVISLVFNRQVVRQVKVHRFLCIKHYGVKHLKNKQVAHLDGNKLNNSISNLWVTDAKSHVYYDQTHKNLRPGKPKESWNPCSYCGDKNGKGYPTPERMTGKRFGIEGQICRRCYRMFQERCRRLKAGGSIGTNRIDRQKFG